MKLCLNERKQLFHVFLFVFFVFFLCVNPGLIEDTCHFRQQTEKKSSNASFHFSVFNKSASPEEAYIASTDKYMYKQYKLKLRDTSYQYPFICEYSMY